MPDESLEASSTTDFGNVPVGSETMLISEKNSGSCSSSNQAVLHETQPLMPVLRPWRRYETYLVSTTGCTIVTQLRQVTAVKKAPGLSQACSRSSTGKKKQLLLHLFSCHPVFDIPSAPSYFVSVLHLVQVDSKSFIPDPV
ncbi:unnamed protein product [Lactuca saligna]|uniref:Uncharacterized protein n=1 Tax=Lactuca saligna TaxID=75948 RepID=A0AA36E3H6_LACSI|nr:unnamed protein product [Lactuca saligna]